MGFEEVKIFLMNFMSSWQIARIYGTEHRLFTESFKKTYNTLLVALSGKVELVIGILEKE